MWAHVIGAISLTKLPPAQEILLILEEYWSRNPQLQAVPIYQASGLAAKSMTIYQTYIEMMNEDIRKAFQVRCPDKLGAAGHTTWALSSLTTPALPCSPGHSETVLLLSLI